MKRQLITALFLTVLNFAALATERDNDDLHSVVRVENQIDHVYTLIYKGKECRKVTIKILDENQNIVFTEQIRKYGSFVRPYNFSGLQEGIYTMMVNDDSGVVTKQIYHRISPVAVLKSDLKYINFTKLSGADNKYKLTIVDFENDDVVVSIFDQQNHLLYEGTELLEDNFAKIYDLGDVDGVLTIEVDIEGEVSTFRSQG